MPTTATSNAADASDVSPECTSNVAETQHASPTRRFVKGAITSLGMRAGGVVATVACYALLARWLGAAPFGEAMLALAWLATLSTLAKGGWEFASARFVSEYASTGQAELLAGFRRHRNWAVLFVSALAGLLMAAALLLFADHFSASMLRACWLMILLLPVVNIVDLLAADLRARQQIAWATAPVIIVRPLLVVALVGGAGTWMSLDASTVLAAWLAVSVLILAALFYRTGALFAGTGPTPLVNISLWWATMAPLAWVAFCHLVFVQSDLLLVGWLSDASDAGVYGVAARISGVVGLGLLTVNAVGGPLLAEQFALCDRWQLQRVVTGMAWGSLALTVPTALAAVALGPWVLAFLGDDFKAAYVPMTVLLFGQVVGSLAGSVSQLLAMTGQQFTSARVLGFFAALQIVLCLVLIPAWGILGAALATTIARAGWNLMLARQAWVTLGINPTAFAFTQPRLAR